MRIVERLHIVRVEVGSQVVGGTSGFRDIVGIGTCVPNHPFGTAVWHLNTVLLGSDVRALESHIGLDRQRLVEELCLQCRLVFQEAARLVARVFAVVIITYCVSRRE
ncbi:hypothetical protein D3C86_1790980 [compost metagenome]